MSVQLKDKVYLQNWYQICVYNVYIYTIHMYVYIEGLVKGSGNHPSCTWITGREFTTVASQSGPSDINPSNNQVFTVENRESYRKYNVVESFSGIHEIHP